MKKYIKFSVVLICCMIMGFSLSSCGDDDEPIISTNVTKADLTGPMFLFANPSSGITSIVNGFSFWSFSNDKAAYGKFTTHGARAYLECSAIYSNWSIENGVLKLGNDINYQMAKTSLLGVKAFAIKTQIFVPSNNTIAGLKAEGIFTNLNYDKARLWRALEKAKASQSGGVYMDEVE